MVVNGQSLALYGALTFIDILSIIRNEPHGRRFEFFEGRMIYELL